MIKYIFAIAIIILNINSKLAAQNRYDVVISELMADPTPVVALPAVEWVELKNITNANINLLGWRLADLTSVSGPMPSYLLKPDSAVIVCSSGSVAALSVYGITISVTSFPSLDNAADIITLRSNTNRTIHAVGYTDDWYANAVKKDGGWSLEMQDTKNPCGGADNWRASIDPRGGTPGTKNSIDAPNADTKAPQLIKTYTNTPTQIVAQFNEPLDSTSAAVVSNYTLATGITIVSALPQAPLFSTVILNLATPLQGSVIYNLLVNGVNDCKGNAIGGFNNARSGLPVDADSLGLLVNEILFNPKSGGYDYVEMINNSTRIYDASKLYIANFNTAGAIANIKKLGETPNLIFPQDYYTVTENATWVKQNYIAPNPASLIELPSLPSFNDVEGNVILLNFQGKILDKLNYKDDWHFKLIDNKEGLSLERVSPTLPTQSADTWHSAAFSAGYGTPTAKNSQQLSSGQAAGTIMVSPSTFSPDGDGFNDLAAISYTLPQKGYLANLTIYDASGRPVRNLRRGELCGLTGTWVWDGLNDKFQKLPTGIYVINTETYNLQGVRKNYKSTIVLARRL